MKSINAVDAEFLKNVADEMNRQDNRMTDSPLFCVMDMKRVESDNGEIDVWIDSEGWEVNPLKVFAELKSENKVDEAVDPEDGWELKEALEANGFHLTHYTEVPEFTGAAFFTESAAKQHLESEEHHLRKPYIYAFSCYRSPEMKQIMRILSRLGDEPNRNAYPGI